jgi:hypothetical protein
VSPDVYNAHTRAIIYEVLKLQLLLAIRCGSLPAEVREGRLVVTGKPLILCMGRDPARYLSGLPKDADWRQLLRKPFRIAAGRLPLLTTETALAAPHARSVPDLVQHSSRWSGHLS